MANKKNSLEANSEIISFPLGELMEDRFGRYAKYVIQERALPDVRDGLKPVQRRILYGMNELKLSYNKPTLKSARIVGDVMGKYHPHGDSSIYEAMVRMSQDWKMGSTLVRMQGNNGSIDGDSAAAYRYTEAKLEKISELLLRDLDKNTVEFAPNYDDKLKEPTVLPAYFPNILVNGSTGIAAGYATNMPPHNLKEVIDVVVAYIKNPDLTLSQAMKYIKGPDFPTGGIIQGVDGIKEAFKTGKGRIILNSKWHEEKETIVIDEIPYEVVKTDLVKKIGEVVDNNPGLGVKEIIDESGREHLVRIAIHLQPKANMEVVRKYLFKQTPLSISYNYNNVVIIDKQPKQVGLLEIIESYVNHYVDVHTRKTQFNLDKALKRLEIVDGLIKAMSILDHVIATIRRSENRGNAISNLIAEFQFSQTQAEAIVDMQLYRLSSTDVSKLKNEKQDLEASIKEYQHLLNDKEAQHEDIINNLLEVKEEYSKKRRSIIEDEVESLDVELKETIVEKSFTLYVSKDGYLKAITNDVKSKNQPETFGRKPGDLWIMEQEVSNMDHLIMISSSGDYYSIPLFKLPNNKWKDSGTHVNQFVTMSGEEKIINAFVVKDFSTAKNQLLLGTKKGLTKRIIISELETKTFNKGFRLIKLGKDDELVSAFLVNSRTNAVGVLTSTGYGVRYDLEDIPLQGTNSKGVKASSKSDDIASIIPLENQNEILFLTDKDNLKKFSQDDLPLYVRPKKGVRLFPERKRGKELLTFGFAIKNDDVLELLTAEDEIKEINLNRLKTSTLKDNLSSSGVHDITAAMINCDNIITPNDIANGSDTYLDDKNSDDDSTMTMTFNPNISATKKVSDSKKVKTNDEVKKTVDSKLNTMGSSLLSDFDFDLPTKNNKNKDEDLDGEDTQLSFDDLLDD
ncbi:DNA topoisomerase IV subunit A [Mesoplasma lactucae]|uniref:DNA topoisomerase (ATP-hydrolyzing) n=1 Tax=Mesoplasma lactucae ATCC 49193 TaxID=81460 RepID=A0A291IRV6_9MOLU|nr:DNA topoisomerase IV subunit A [Mesoplasma lactucae]ATG97427.1 DNA topoisomerase IV subunit A [Mesoplasma lactucae ATCC 49193]ATZ20120.1 DNA topoisomerase IV subunit A [Mesoplasma lactucae ATCC 49193]MCL8216868.1 DNA topoisomerase 4 subunit A [Mesoplasma lactucae ATCC 49193]